MYKAFYEHAQLLELPIVAMIIFAVTFSAVVVKVVFSSQREKAQSDEAARLPLMDDSGDLSSGALSLSGDR